MHIPHADHLAAILRNVSNLRAALDPDDKIDVVTHGPGLDLLLETTEHAATVTDLIRQGVQFSACRNTLASRALTAADLVPGATLIDSAVGHLAQRQWDGYAYLRP